MIVGGKLVWVRSQKGPVPEKWPMNMPSEQRNGKYVLAEHELSVDEFAMKIAILEQRYPPPPA
jgi:hypothetical protein